MRTNRITSATVAAVLLLGATACENEDDGADMDEMEETDEMDDSDDMSDDAGEGDMEEDMEGGEG